MISPSSLRAIAVQPPAEAGKAAEAPSVRRPEEEASPRKPVTDEYVPEEKEEPSGRYWPGRDEDGQPRIYFDAPEDAAAGSEKPDGGPAAPEPEKGGQTEERCTGDTGGVDREIQRLRKKRQDLAQRLDAETDGEKARDLERQLAQVERELRQKDNDAYRRQHTRFT